jgi:FAD dependent oxidoreductase TIGR03364
VSESSEFDVAVVGAGVIGAFHAYHACRRGLRVLLLERGELPPAASVRNFGMIIPSGMTPGDWHRRALVSAAIYRELAAQFPFPLFPAGTQYLAVTPNEARVLEEFARLGPEQGYRCTLRDGSESAAFNAVVDPSSCLTSLHFPDDLRLEPRAFFHAFIPWMAETLGCAYRPRTVVTRVAVEGGACRVTTAAGEEYRARHVFVCGGADLRTLFPERLAAAGLVSCKLQMMRLEAPDGLRLAASLASGLTLRRYPSFRLCPSWARLEEDEYDPELGRRGIHILLVQDGDGRLVLGDSHEYGGDLDDNLDARTEELILSEARRLVRLPHWRIAGHWPGVYALHPEREVFVETLEDRVHIVTGIGGKGMTTGPALARESVERHL